MNQADLWKTHPIVSFRISGHDTGQFLENSSRYGRFFQKSHGSCPDILQKTEKVLIKNGWMNSPEIGPAQAPGIEISQKNWISRICH